MKILSGPEVNTLVEYWERLLAEIVDMDELPTPLANAADSFHDAMSTFDREGDDDEDIFLFQIEPEDQNYSNTGVPIALWSMVPVFGAISTDEKNVAVAIGRTISKVYAGRTVRITRAYLEHGIFVSEAGNE